MTDRKAYMRAYMQKRRRNAEKAGLCNSCTARPARMGEYELLTCQECSDRGKRMMQTSRTKAAVRRLLRGD